MKSSCPFGKTIVHTYSQLPMTQWFLQPKAARYWHLGRKQYPGFECCHIWTWDYFRRVNVVVGFKKRWNRGLVKVCKRAFFGNAASYLTSIKESTSYYIVNPGSYKLCTTSVSIYWPECEKWWRNDYMPFDIVMAPRSLERLASWLTALPYTSQ